MPRRRSHAIAVAIAATAGLTTAATPALAAWGPVLRPAASANAAKVALAVDGRGAAGVAWVQTRGRTVTVRATAARGARPAATRTLLRSRDRAIAGLTTAIDRRGELTVAWVDRAVTAGLLHGPITVRAAYRTPAGRWSRTQAVSASSAFAYAQPQLAAARDGTVVLVFNAGVRAAPGVGAAWRTAGRPFGRVRAVATGRHGYLQEPTLAFDPRGRAYLAGIAGCDDESHSAGVVLTATARGRRFGPHRTVTPAPANHLRLVLTGGDHALLAWVGAGCSTTEDLSGPIRAATLADGLPGAPAEVTPVPSTGLGLVGAPGGGDVIFTQFGPTVPAGTALVAHIAPDGSLSAPTEPAGGWAPAAADGSGDQVVETALPVNAGPSMAIGARPATGGPVEPAPLPGPVFFAVAGAPDGAALAAARPARRALEIAVWRPAAAARAGH